jgi:hypothetical protein
VGVSTRSLAAGWVISTNIERLAFLDLNEILRFSQ